MAAAVKHLTPGTGDDDARSGEIRDAADGRSERWRAHRDTRREAYIDAALRAIEKFGPDAKMEQIAAVAGVAKPKLYRYFADRADLVHAIGDRCGHEVAGRMSAALDPSTSLRQTIETGLDGFLSFVEENPNTIRFLLNSVGSNTQNVIVTNGRMIAALLVPLMSADLEAANADSDAAQPLAHAMIGAILGATDWWLQEDPETRMSRARLVAHLTTVVVGAATATLDRTGRRLDPDAPLFALLARQSAR